MALDWRNLQPLDPTVNAHRFDLNATGTPLARGDTFAYWDVRDLATVCVQAIKETTWATAVFTLERSLNGCAWAALETPETIGIGGGMSSTIDCTGFDYIRARLSTLEGSAVYAKLLSFGKASK